MVIAKLICSREMTHCSPPLFAMAELRAYCNAPSIFAGLKPSNIELTSERVKPRSNLIFFLLIQSLIMRFDMEESAAKNGTFSVNRPARKKAGSIISGLLVPAMKMTSFGLSSSMTVITDKRSYQFVIRSTGDGSKWYQRVSWRIPSTFVFDEGGQQSNVLVTERAKQAQSKPAEVVAGIDPERLSYEYEIAGDAPFRPSVVSDDGVKTYIKLPKGLQELPVLFAVQDGQFTLVNYSVRGDYLIVQLVQDVFILKIGRKEVKISKKAQEKSVVDTFKNILGGG